MISDDETVLINGGTTTLEVVRALAGKRNLTVVTNDLRVPGELPPDVGPRLESVEDDPALRAGTG